MKNMYDKTKNEWKQELTNQGYKSFGATQIFDWVYKKQVSHIDEMTNISKTLRNYLKDQYTLAKLEVESHQISSDGTEKFLFRLGDGNIIETVLMRHNYGNSVCVTTQLGCNIGCTFCASGLQKKLRDLNAGEIVQQVMMVQEIAKERISHIVVMGIGEPFDNYDQTMRFIDIVNDPNGLEIGARHITVSTSGIVPKIKQFAHEDKQVNLAISLHAPTDDIRSSIMKINQVYPIKEVIEAAKYYVKETNRRITFEYILLEGVNDQIHHADQLSTLLRGINCYVNLIRYNPVDEFLYSGTNEHAAKAFHKRLMDRGITATLRREKGGDIDAACGQLRSKKLTRID